MQTTDNELNNLIACLVTTRYCLLSISIKKKKKSKRLREDKELFSNYERHHGNDVGGLSVGDLCNSSKTHKCLDNRADALFATVSEELKRISYLQVWFFQRDNCSCPTCCSLLECPVNDLAVLVAHQSRGSSLAFFSFPQCCIVNILFCACVLPTQCF